MLYLTSSLFFIIPLLSIVFFIVSICLYFNARKQNSRLPGSVSSQKLNTLLIMLIISSVIVGVMAIVVIGFILLMFSAVAFM